MKQLAATTIGIETASPTIGVGGDLSATFLSTENVLEGGRLVRFKYELSPNFDFIWRMRPFHYGDLLGQSIIVPMARMKKHSGELLFGTQPNDGSFGWQFWIEQLESAPFSGIYMAYGTVSLTLE